MTPKSAFEKTTGVHHHSNNGAPKSKTDMFQPLSKLTRWVIVTPLILWAVYEIVKVILSLKGIIP